MERLEVAATVDVYVFPLSYTLPPVLLVLHHAPRVLLQVLAASSLCYDGRARDAVYGKISSQQVYLRMFQKLWDIARVECSRSCAQDIRGECSRRFGTLLESNVPGALGHC